MLQQEVVGLRHVQVPRPRQVKALIGKRRRRENRGPVGAEWVGYAEGCPLPSQLGVWGSVEVRDEAPTGNTFLAYFEGQKTLPIAPTYDHATKVRLSVP